MILKQGIGYNRAFFLKATSDHYSALTGASPTVTLSKNGAAFGAMGGTVTEIGSGYYKATLNASDTNTVGDLAFYITAASADPAFFVDQVNTYVFSDLLVDSSGNVSIASNIKKNQALSGFTFIMTNSTTHVPQTGLTVAAQRSLAGAGFAPCANSPTELSNGCYSINLAATDLNANSVFLRFTATGADDLNIEVLTQP